MPEALRSVLATRRPLRARRIIPEVRPTILIVDDHAEFRRVARALLQADGFDVVGEAADGATAVHEVARLLPRVVLLDLQLPDIDGFAVAELLATQRNPPAVILISSRDAREYGPRLRQAAAVGYIPKSGLSGPSIRQMLEW